MKILTYGQDMGQAKSLARVTVEALERGHPVRSVFFNKILNQEDLSHLLSWKPSAILMGLATMSNEFEIALTFEAQKQNIPVFWLFDAYGIFGRPAIGNTRPDGVFVLDEGEKEKALRLGYPRVIISNAPLWEDFCDLTNYHNANSARSAFGVCDYDYLILLSGIKIGKITLQVLEDVVWAIKELEDMGIRCVFWPRFHPGDENVKSGYYAYFLKSLSIRWHDTATTFESTYTLLLAPNVIVSLFSTVGIAGVYLGKNVIDYLPPYVCDRLEELTGERTWNPAELGATYKAETKEALKKAFLRLRHNERHQQNLRKQQEHYYPLLQKGASAKIILKEIEIFCSRG